VDESETVQVLERELQHRVSNNLQLLLSIVDLQILTISSQTARKALELTKSRIMAVALVNELNLAAGCSGFVDAQELARSYAAILTQSSLGHEGRFQLSVEGPSMNLDVDTAIPLTLIASEFTEAAAASRLRGEREIPLSISWETEARQGAFLQFGCGEAIRFDPERREFISRMAGQIGARVQLLQTSSLFSLLVLFA
jgi:Signal transduction histidine kinase